MPYGPSRSLRRRFWLLIRAGVPATEAGLGYWTFDVNAYLKLVKKAPAGISCPATPLRGPVAQKMIMDQTSRRPAVPGSSWMQGSVIGSSSSCRFLRSAPSSTN